MRNKFRQYAFTKLIKRGFNFQFLAENFLNQEKASMEAIGDLEEDSDEWANVGAPGEEDAAGSSDIEDLLNGNCFKSWFKFQYFFTTFKPHTVGSDS